MLVAKFLLVVATHPTILFEFSQKYAHIAEYATRNPKTIENKLRSIN